MFKAFLTGALILTSAALPAAAQEIGPGIGGTRVANESYYVAHVCTNNSNGRLSLRTGPSQSNRKIMELSNRTNIDVLGNIEGRDGFVWFKVRYNVTGANGWVRSDYVCNGSIATTERY
ncbi:SH3 domain-containing protein [Iningainema tapete]|uniref:SH3 domain-containing protein n=1 Tax=Iningainema tapete BLCC-T55 TaxID=2748662 RepID=A0A8J6XKU7_9CYAN|nr:SH3 domain-containing protein [Iningainema tapete]MBD2778104.1 SH3 domain-containing protein [Iningainema tapete BLCC-T55]